MAVRLGRFARKLAFGLVTGTLLVLILVALLLVVIDSAWGQNRIRQLMVSQANNVLSATLEIDHLSGSILRGVRLTGVRLIRDGRTFISIDDVLVAYSIRELLQSGGPVVRSVHATRPIVVVRREDGRWNLSWWLKRPRQPGGRGATFQIPSITVVDATVVLEDPLLFGPAHVQRRFERLNASMGLSAKTGDWTFDFGEVSWSGGPSELTVERLTGRMTRGNAGWSFDKFLVDTPRSLFTLDGRVVTGGRPAVLDLDVDGDRFAFQEWAGIIHGLRNIAVDGAFTAKLAGTLTNLATQIDLRSDGGNARGRLVLNTKVPGWLAAGTVNLTGLNLARWLNRPDRPSDFTGSATFDLALNLGRGIPRGPIAFNGPRASYFGYEGENVRVRGDLTPDEWRIAAASAVAYGADVVLSSSTVGLKSPYPFQFRGVARDVDLRTLPAIVPVPRVESTLAFEFDADGRFSQPYLNGRAWFERSTFIGAAVMEGTVGSLDTRAMPLAYAGEGDVRGLDIRRFGEALQVPWMQDTRWAGTVNGHFRVQGSGARRDTMQLTGGGHLTRADAFHGTLSDAEVEVQIEDGTLSGSYAGRFAGIDPAVPFADDRFAASLTGDARLQFTVQDLLLRPPRPDDYTIDGTMTLEPSVIRGVQVSSGSTTSRLASSVLTVGQLTAESPLFKGRGTGVIDFSSAEESAFDYEIQRADLAIVKDVFDGPEVQGQFTTTGTARGRLPEMRIVGEGIANDIKVSQAEILKATGVYDVVVPLDAPARAVGGASLDASFLTLAGRSLQRATASLEYADENIGFTGELAPEGWPTAQLVGRVHVRPEGQAIDVLALTATSQSLEWTLAPAVTPPIVSWKDGSIAVSRAVLVDAKHADQRLELSGDWRSDGNGALRVLASDLSLDTLIGPPGAPTRYGGIVNADATLRGTLDRPVVNGRLTVTEGRVARVSYERLAGAVDYVDGLFKVDLRLDQSPGIWFTAAGTVPPSLFFGESRDGSIDVKVQSSSVSLGLVEGLTDAVRDATGEALIDLTVGGTLRSPQFLGTVNLAKAGFRVEATGAVYKNGNVKLDFGEDRVTVAAFTLEDRNGHPLIVSGSLGTRELRVGELAIDITAKGFEVLRNQLGTMEVQTSDLAIRGPLEAPRISGNITVLNGELRVDDILSRALLQPYATEALDLPGLETIRALNIWDRLSMNILLHSLGGLRMTGDSVTVSSNAPLGLGSFDIRAAGDINVYKDPGEEVSVSGSLDSLTGTFAFQGRRFELYPSSSVDFQGDFKNPELFFTVFRVVSGVETRVTISGPLHSPELRLSSNPPLDPSDVLSLIVFNTTTNELSSAQQQELGVRAGALAVGFLASTLTGALERSLGIDILEIEPTAGVDAGAKVTVGQEIAPGLVARFSRHFGSLPYDEATLEYRISRMLSIRASFSDATAVGLRSPFRRVERAVVDLLFFFSF